MINTQEFKIEPNENRFNFYLDNFLFKYVKDKNIVLSKIVETNTKNIGVKVLNKEITCLLPKRNTLFDEMISIHEITHLIHELYNNYYLDFRAREIIPFFNEYNYLLINDKNLAKEYLLFRKTLSKEIVQNNKDDDYNISYLYAYLVLVKRKNDFNINYLNKINAKKNNLEKVLKQKRYTL